PGTTMPRPIQLKVGFGEVVDVPDMLQQGRSEQEIQDLVYERVCGIGKRLRGCDVRDDSAEEPEAVNSTATASMTANGTAA
ncbi:MAG TPA: hypothetical protein PKM25_14895, partial [Candidatus Ozemobacteraceae bacterium]|nr:hypothetical protein [Candidatus Ozemobacteraceae bacterium]